MVNTHSHALALVAVIAGVTALLRFLPFVLFSRRTPQLVLYLGRVLPYAVIAMLVVYCVKDVHPLSGSHGLPEAISIALVVVLHRWKHNTLLSMLAGTVCYMLLIQLVFA